MKKEFESEKSTLYDIKDDEERTKKANELKKKSLEIEKLVWKVKTQEEFAEELKCALISAKTALRDLKKAFPDGKIDPETKLFIEKREKKIARIEKDFEEGNKTPEELLKELDDSSDID